MSWFAGSKDYQNAEFVAKYVEMFGGTPDDIEEDSANAFTVGQVLQQAVEKIKSIDNKLLIDELHRGTYKTVGGPLSFGAAGRPQGGLLLPPGRGPQGPTAW